MSDKGHPLAQRVFGHAKFIRGLLQVDEVVDVIDKQTADRLQTTGGGFRVNSGRA